ncbi:MAG: flagellar hook-basal body complex protein FliE [Planctomycetes bacterium]|nr:flagellar hook-basal body complex protein FliE [Planctomycetota bacterium]MCK5566030.1 flagellar hook-basal body complex protein FliE [Planctomycetota bacterium]
MSVNFNPSFNSVLSTKLGGVNSIKPPENNTGKNLIDGLRKTNELMNVEQASISDMLTGKNQDINSVVADVAKADMSFKLLVGVRDKLVAAYKETMKMQI